MNIPLISKSDSDVSSNSSWSVISESEDPEPISERNEVISKCDSDSKSKDINLSEENFVHICENNSPEVTESENEGNNTGLVYVDQGTKSVKQQQQSKPKKVKSKNKKPKKNRKKEKAETLSILSLAASVLTITGITFLCMLFPQNIEKEAIQNVQKTYIDAITNKNANAENFLNKTADIYDVINKADFFKKMRNNLNKTDSFIDEELCSPDDNYDFDPYRLNFMPPSTVEASDEEKLSFESKSEPPTTYQQVQNKTLGLIKNVKRILMDPNLQIFICTVLQDICLIKLVNQLNKQQMEKSTNDGDMCPDKISVPISKKKKGIRVKNLKSKQNIKVNKKSNKNPTIDIKTSSQGPSVSTKSSAMREELNSSPNIKLHLKSEKENGKSECEKRFEELDNKWEAAGHLHRQKIEEIKENFKNEMFYIKENEKEHSLRRERIQLLREKYIDRLRMDREKYLRKLQKLREERQRIMKHLCQKKSVDAELKDASVGNYAVLLPDSYDFQQKLQLIKNQDHDTRISLPSIPTASFPKIGAVKNSKFIKFQSIPNIPKQAMRKLNINATTESINVEKQKYIEKVKKYYEMKKEYMQKKSLVNKKENDKFDFASKTAKSIGKALVEDIISRMVINIQEPAKKLQESSSDSSVETVKENEALKSGNTSEADVIAEKQMEVVNQNFKLVVKRKPKKRDLYEVAFDGKSKKVKQDDIMKWSLERKEKLHRLPQHQMLTKQDPQKAYKEKIIIKGHI